ncbi:hypothetical protein ACKKBG_A30295 [Auxenochlorella protothecoides x Auxenochlorella symbiontica]|uniref:PCI domain-containing protein n=1 Tax=Auxenochlorella protothecoides TaxID=3075 RepID=A0A1D1ZUK2_AUXPR
MSSIGGLVHSINDCINRRNSARLRLLLQVNNSTTQEAVFAARNANPRWDPVAAANRLPEGWAEFLALFWACIVALQEGKRGEAYDKLVAALQPFIKVFREDSEDWVVPLMHSMVHNLRSVAQAADQELEAAGKPATRLGDCGDQLRKCFAVALQAPGNQGKRLAALDVVNVSIKTYFKLNTLRLCKNLTRTVVSRQFAPFELFPVSQRVTYKFYVGRLAVFDENFQEARESLEYALQHCHRGAVRNKAKILKYLVPVQLLLGRFPSAALVQQYQLQQYQPLMQAMRTGDMRLFDTTMDVQQFTFIQEGTYLLLEKLRLAVLRRLLKQVHAVHAVAEPGKATQIPLDWVLAALRCQTAAAPQQEEEMTMDEVECVCANLIYRKYVRGYISHKNKVMVVAKSEPFPPLASISFADG